MNWQKGVKWKKFYELKRNNTEANNLHLWH